MKTSKKRPCPKCMKYELKAKYDRVQFIYEEIKEIGAHLLDITPPKRSKEKISIWCNSCGYVEEFEPLDKE